jgi:hypothetical protein
VGGSVAGVAMVSGTGRCCWFGIASGGTLGLRGGTLSEAGTIRRRNGELGANTPW